MSPFGFGGGAVAKEAITMTQKAVDRLGVVQQVVGDSYGRKMRLGRWA